MIINQLFFYAQWCKNPKDCLEIMLSFQMHTDWINHYIQGFTEQIDTFMWIIILS